MMAILSPLVSRCRSRQLAATLSAPSSNHLIETGRSKLVFCTTVNGLIQSTRLACSRQNASVFPTDSAYMRRYPASSISAWAATSAGTGNSLLASVMNAVFPVQADDFRAFYGRAADGTSYRAIDRLFEIGVDQVKLSGATAPPEMMKVSASFTVQSSGVSVAEGTSST